MKKAALVDEDQGEGLRRRPPAHMRQASREYKAALVQALSDYGGDFHVVAQLPVGKSRAALEDALYRWVARVDHYYLGRSWSAPRRKAERMKGIVFFETSGGNEHAHLIVTVPEGASKLSFMLHARLFFERHPVRELRRVYRKAVTERGKMWVRRIEDTEADRLRVINYVSKGLERRHRPDIWKFLDELSPLQAA